MEAFMKQLKWTEKKIASMQAKGFGKGSGAHYKPWIEVTDISSQGRKSWVPSTKCGRVIHTLSDVEHDLCLLLDWSDDVVDINEQYPLDREITTQIAHELRIPHPYYGLTQIPVVMTVDFMVTITRNGKPELEAFNAKDTEKALDERTMLKLEIVRESLAQMEVPHHLVIGSQLPAKLIENLTSIVKATPQPDELEDYPGALEDMTNRFRSHFAHVIQRQPQQQLFEAAMEFDRIHSVASGSGLRAAKALVKQKEVLCDLTQTSIDKMQLAAFSIRNAATAGLRQAGGAR
jgi:hypothetical protein